MNIIFHVKITFVKKYSHGNVKEKKRSLITFLWSVRKRSWERKTAVRETDRRTDTRTHLTNGRTNKQTDR